MTTSSNKKKRLSGIRKKIYDDLKEQLLLADNFNSYTDDLLKDYLEMYDTKCLLSQDIIKRGVSVEYNNGGGQKGVRSNPSIDLRNRTNAQMLRLLDSLGLKPSKIKNSQSLDDSDDDDEL